MSKKKEVKEDNWKVDLLELVKSNEDELVAINIRGVLFKKDQLKLALAKLDRNFDGGFGGTEGDPFWAWGKKNVYFCAEYDGSEWVTCIPIKPSKGEPHHIGGG